MRPHGAEELKHPDAGVYIVGMKSYGRAPTFLLLTGYEQVRSVVAALAGDWEAARRVELVLPETGVCITHFEDEAPAAAAACCGTAPVAATSAEAASGCGSGGCGVPTRAAEPTPAEAGCCGGPPKDGSDACCVRDAEAKAEGRSGCGCGSKPAAAPAPKTAAAVACCG